MPLNPPTEEEGRAAYRRSLESNLVISCHGRRSKPISAEKWAELARQYDSALKETGLSPV